MCKFLGSSHCHGLEWLFTEVCSQSRRLSIFHKSLHFMHQNAEAPSLAQSKLLSPSPPSIHKFPPFRSPLLVSFSFLLPSSLHHASFPPLHFTFTFPESWLCSRCIPIMRKGNTQTERAERGLFEEQCLTRIVVCLLQECVLGVGRRSLPHLLEKAV